jgi:hypothetical protein
MASSLLRARRAQRARLTFAAADERETTKLSLFIGAIYRSQAPGALAARTMISNLLRCTLSRKIMVIEMC